MKDRYIHELEQRGPRPEELERLYEMIEGGTEMKRTKGFSSRAVVIAVCAVLTITAAAAAAVPAVWEGLWRQLGVFAPYAQTIDGAVCRDQGIEVRMLSALSDDLEARFYFSVQDVTGDHQLNEHLTLTGRLECGEEKEQEPKSVGCLSGSVSSSFKLLSYDPETRTALFSSSLSYGETYRPNQRASLSLARMATQNAKISGTVPCASITDEVLKSLPAEEDDRIIFKPSGAGGFKYADIVLPDQQVVLAPEQNPMPIEGTEDMWISSMGFASDGYFHVRLGFADGISVIKENGDRWFLCTLGQSGKSSEADIAMWERLVPGGLDILFPLYTVEDLEQLQNGMVELYGDYTRPGTVVEGAWNIDFELEYYSSVVLDWVGELAGSQVRQVAVSPLSVTMYSDDAGSFAYATLYAVKKDGSTVSAEPDAGRYSNLAFDSGSDKPVWDAFNTWIFEEPVELEDLVSLSLMDETIPVD